MTTKLDGVLKREIDIAGVAYTLTLTPHGLSLVLKGKRKGLDLAWPDLVSGEAALATALNASLSANLRPSTTASASTVPESSATPKKR